MISVGINGRGGGDVPRTVYYVTRSRDTWIGFQRIIYNLVKRTERKRGDIRGRNGKTLQPKVHGGTKKATDAEAEDLRSDGRKRKMPRQRDRNCPARSGRNFDASRTVSSLLRNFRDREGPIHTRRSLNAKLRAGYPGWRSFNDAH